MQDAAGPPLFASQGWKGDLQSQQPEMLPEKQVHIGKIPKYHDFKESMFCWYFLNNLSAAASEGCSDQGMKSNNYLGSCRIKMGRVKQAGKCMSDCLSPFFYHRPTSGGAPHRSPAAPSTKGWQSGRKAARLCAVFAGSNCFSCKR